MKLGYDLGHYFLDVLIYDLVFVVAKYPCYLVITIGYSADRIAISAASYDACVGVFAIF
jgi:hypothetical protein